MSFNHACPDVPAPVIADSAVLLGPAGIGAGTALAQGTVVRSPPEAVSIGIHSASWRTPASARATICVVIRKRTVFRHAAR